MRADIGADAAEPEEVHRALEDRGDDLARRALALVPADRRGGFLRQADALVAPREDAAAGGDLVAVVVGPGRARLFEQPLALGKGGFAGSGSGIDEDVAMVEGGDEPGLARQQHAVAEHVARHVAAAGGRERLLLDVPGLVALAHLAEMPLHRLPGAARGDAHGLVVVAGGPAGWRRRRRARNPRTGRWRWRCRRRSPCPCRRRRRNRDRRRRGGGPCRASRPCRRRDCPSPTGARRRRRHRPSGPPRTRRRAGRHPAGAWERSRPWRRPAR